MRARTVWKRLPAGVPPRAVDVTLAVADMVVSLLLAREDPTGNWRHTDTFGFVLIVLINLPLLVRRRAPVAVLLGMLTLQIWFIALGYWPVVNSLGSLLALYTVASHRPVRIAVAAIAAVGATWIYAGLAADGGSMATVVGQILTVPPVVCWFGTAARRLGERNAQLALLTAKLAREQEARARRAVTDERVRIARELHDVVAHHVSVISVQAGLAEYVITSDPSTAQAALHTIGETTREALDEMRRMLLLLRADPADMDEARVSGPDRPADDHTMDPAPGLARLDDVVRRIRAAGVAVAIRRVGVARPLSPGVELCAYRIVQEALTNVLKHARTARVELTVEYEPTRLRIAVCDDGGEPDPDATPQTRNSGRIGGASGHGLIGMSERARLYGGTFSAGPRREGGFEVGLVLPIPAEPGTSGGKVGGTGDI
ncbi:sensor histidine kinase [Embleya scabrispora]|uniref:sensor histidine kinase n=1 Tax=Embleya scabrispora TaxID=159449 RepID=UPI001912BA97|nr:sensor histidine kinase [Embleya scabrispora]